MSNLYIIHLEQLETRYTGQWRKWLDAEFSKHCNVFNIEGPVLESRTDNKSFLNWSDTIVFKCSQMVEVANLFKEGVIKSGDKFLFSDGWNPEVVSLRYLSVMNNIPIKIYGMFHAGSWDTSDLVYQNGGALYFRRIENGVFDCLDKAFVATEYHKKIICNTFKSIDTSKIIVTGFPYIFEELDSYKNIEKRNLVLFPHRLSSEKQPEMLKEIEEDLSVIYGVDTIFCQESKLTKHEYHTLLGESKIIFSASLQETWGIGAFEGMYLNSIPVLPNRLSYKEMYYDQFKYPHGWTSCKESFLKNKDKLVLYIIEKIENHEKYKVIMDKNISLLKDKYCTIEKIIKETLN